MSESVQLTQKDLLRRLGFVSGVGPERAELLAKLDLHTVADVLFFFPRAYEDLTETQKIEDLKPGESATVIGVIRNVERKMTRTGKQMVGVLIQQDFQTIKAIWFKPPWSVRDLKAGQAVAIHGKPKKVSNRWEVVHPKLIRLELPDGQSVSDSSTLNSDFVSEKKESSDYFWLGKFRPVYPLTEGLLQPEMRKITKDIVQRFSDLLEEALPEDLLERHRFVGIREALLGIHLPEKQVQVDQGRKRLVYQELLVLQLALAMRRYKMTVDSASPEICDSSKVRGRILRLFPFELTGDQIGAIDDIVGDMKQGRPMNRLVQGDVGCGKTVVAVYAMLLAVAEGFQNALMAPTEVLARQHHRSITKQLKSSRVQVEILTGSTSAADRRRIEKDLQSGKIDILIGTQSLIQNQLPWKSLGLVVIDEQHKFGVKQRAKLRSDGFDPHYLVMTATPIPRSAAMTLFGDLDLTVIREKPKDRREVKSYPVEPEKMDSWWKFFRQQIEEGRQGFVVVPRVEMEEADKEPGEVEPEVKEISSVKQAFEELQGGPLAGLKCELLHGSMDSHQKQQVMESMVRGHTQVLISTTVVEVGIDIPNASVMAIYNPSQLGLNQLHQLRGRVGRGEFVGYVGLIPQTDDEEKLKRIQLFCKTTDGFDLARADMEIRGPGDLLGTRQHGLPPLRIADLLRDENWVKAARSDAKKIVQTDPDLSDPSLQRLRQLVMNKYGKVLELGDVG